MTTENHTLIITGGAGGLGKAIAQADLGAGSHDALCDISAPRIEAATKDLASDKLLALTADITDEDASKAFVDAVVAKFGRLDMLVNNAGVMDSFDPVATLSKTTFDRVMGVNVTGTYLMSKAAVNVMLPQGGGTIINIGSVASYKGNASGAAYTASKHAVAGLTKNTASFYGDKGVNCLILMLGGMDDTNITESLALGVNMEIMGKMQEQNPGYVQGQTGVQLADVAKYCVFFSDKAVARASNGAEIKVNNNWPAA
jgi:NAD(P)-dependent dehydrogenase (short-subunit alcohol dehydrogenase family)